MSGRRPLEGIRILLTRAGDGDDAAVAPFRDLGATVDTVPLIRIGPAPNERAVRHAATRAREFDWIIFTSRHGVDAFARALRGQDEGLPRIAAIGPATGAAVRERFGRPADVVPGEFVAEALAQTLVRAARHHSRMLLVQASDARLVLRDRLRAAGFSVECVAAYTTVEQAPHDIDRHVRDADVIVLASGSAARSLANGLGAAAAAAATRGKVIACIGAVTESEARRAGFHVEIIPRDATFRAVADSIARYYEEPAPDGLM